ncbi:uncharacterized protein LOC101893360 isoform X1 [Musca domestica]|uniref:Golgi apparatus membrane protein tvp38 isoform X1 n=1 Tax=Musca domestica TaxID=7370 RepID=A0A1I8M7K0_MUSDO|nr:uncharacterized protein LOC101893360 isoform X1 [Musca domestica]
MSVSSTLTLSRVSSFEENQYKSHCGGGGVGYQSGLNTNSHHKNNLSGSATFYQFPGIERSPCHRDYTLSNSKTEPMHLKLDDDPALERLESPTPAIAIAATPATSLLLHKSNSYNGMSLKPKSTIIKQDSFNGRINTSLTDSDSEYGSAILIGCNNTTPLEGMIHTAAASLCANEEDCDEHDSFLISSNGIADAAAAAAASTNSSSPPPLLSAKNRRSTHRANSKTRSSICYRANAFISRNWYLSYLVPLSILLALMFVAYLTRDYAKRLLFWIETQNPWVIFAVFMLLFVVVSFPIVVGYFVLMITAGYLFGLIRGFLTVILGANMGIAIAHLTLRSLKHRLPVQKLIKNETGRAILRVISGPRAFRVVLFTRLTPIPFGIQNAIFGVSTINPKVYHTATFLGLLPAQLINVYLGSTLRSMHEVLNNHGTAITGYISFGVEVVCGIALMFWVVQKARKELSETLLTDIGNDGKLIDIQV